jgi:hypothetical protein
LVSTPRAEGVVALIEGVDGTVWTGPMQQQATTFVPAPHACCRAAHTRCTESTAGAPVPKATAATAVRTNIRPRREIVTTDGFAQLVPSRF